MSQQTQTTLDIEKIIATRQDPAASSAAAPSALEYGEVAVDIDGVLRTGNKNGQVVTHVVSTDDRLTDTRNPRVTQLSTENLNSITTPGFYYAGGGNTVTNKPSGIAAFGLLVERTAQGYYSQILIGADSLSNKMFIRQCIGTNQSWGAWQSFYTTAYKPTLSELGAAAATHTHTKSQITDFPTSLKNPTSIKIQLNGGTTEGTNQFTYDGSAAKNINITPSSIGASASGHTHQYLPLAGGTMTGAITLPGNPTSNLHAATKQYVDSQIAGSGSGDMLKSVYDTDGDGVVDKAEKLSGLTASRVLVTDSSGNSVVSAVTSTELGYLDGVTSSVQTQLNGKAASTHTHTKSQITDFPTSLKNPTSIKIQLNGGTTEGTNQFTYDGSAAKNINITPASIGAATSSHTQAASTITGLTANRALISDASGHPAVSAVTNVELGYLDGAKSNIQSQIDSKVAITELITKIKDYLYPIGSIFEWVPTFSSPDLYTPSQVASYFGFGTWELYGKGRVTVGIDSKDTDFVLSGKTGGEKKHTITIDEMPNHNHVDNDRIQWTNTAGVGIRSDYSDNTNMRVDYGTTYTQGTGGGQAHNNLQPYIVVYRFRRIA